MNARVNLAVGILYSLTLLQYTRADEGRLTKCPQLIQEALEKYEKDHEGTTQFSPEKCSFLRDMVAPECHEEFLKMCPEPNKRSIADQSMSGKELTSNSDGRITRPGRSSRVVKRSVRTKRELEDACDQPEADCEFPDAYRTFDGSCNNMVNHEWGRANRIQSGELWAAYDDGYDVPRIWGRYVPLPNARRVSNVIHEASAQLEEDPNRSLFVMQAGQFLAHDFALTEMFKRPDGSPLDCCGADIANNECFTITVPSNDPHFEPGRCLNFARSEARRHCYTGIREQVNSQSSQIDLSMTYGVTVEESNELRTLTGGLLKTIQDKLPGDATNPCSLSMPLHITDYYCPKAGDPRVVETSGLASIHTIWVREHNRLAAGLAARHPTWTDEVLFQEARKIAIAEWQHIVYNEFLPATLGMAALTQNNMDVTASGYKDTYAVAVDATIVNSFAAAIFRFGHTLVPDKIGLAQMDDETVIQEDALEHTFDDPLLYHANGGKGTDNILKYMSDKPCPMADRKIQPSVQRRLFPDSMNKSLDLAAANIQRAREHGVPPYNDFREFVCGLPRATHFGVSLGGLVDHTQGVANLLQTVYNHPDDIDLFTGQMSEIRLPNSQHGPTSQCLMTRQFKRLRDGDRFFYERNDPAILFSLNQLNEIKNVQMSTLFCLNTENIAGKRIQGNMFFVQSATNAYVDCSTVQGIDFTKF